MWHIGPSKAGVFEQQGVFQSRTLQSSHLSPNQIRQPGSLKWGCGAGRNIKRTFPALFPGFRSHTLPWQSFCSVCGLFFDFAIAFLNQKL